MPEINAGTSFTYAKTRISPLCRFVFFRRKELVKDGYTIIATVHSPTSFAFSLFDDLMMLQAFELSI